MRAALGVLLALVVAGGAAAQPPTSRMTRQVAHLVEAGQAYGINYWQYLPPRSFHGRPPVLIFLHGYGERGVDDDPAELNLVALHGPPLLVEQGNGLCFGGQCFLMLAPQALPDHDWYGSSLVPIVNAMIDRARALGGDMSRVYLTGLSMGGIGTWSYAGAPRFTGGGGLWGTRLAAIVPIAGQVDTWLGCNIARAGVAVWAFHGTADTTVDPRGSIDGVRAVNACHPREKAILTLYSGVGHDSWTRTYDPRSRFDPRTGRPDPDGVNLYEWLLRHRRSEQK